MQHVTPTYVLEITVKSHFTALLAMLQDVNL